MGAPRREGDGAARLYGRGPVAGSARGTVVIVAGPDGTPVPVEVDAAVADALRDMRREAWRIERREARHTLGLDAMGPSAASTGPESDPGFALMKHCQADELVGAVPAAESPASPPTHACRRAPPGQGDRPSRGLLRAGGEVQPCARTEADEGLVDRRGLKVAQARSAPARTGLSIPGSKMIRLGDHAAGKPPRVSVPRTPP